MLTINRPIKNFWARYFFPKVFSRLWEKIYHIFEVQLEVRKLSSSDASKNTLKTNYSA